MKKVMKLSALCFALASLVFLSACEKDEDTPATNNTPTLNANETAANKLKGTWDATSYKYDGEEQINFTVSSYELRFTLQTSNSGNVKETIVYNDGPTDNFNYDFSVVSEGSTFKWDGTDYDLTFINDSKIELQGNEDGFDIIIKLNKI